MAAARWASTDVPVLLTRTVSRPSHAWNSTSSTANRLGHRIDRRSRWSFQARNATARIIRPMTEAIARWTHSHHAFVSSSGGSTPL